MERKGKRTILGGYIKYGFREHDVILDQIDRVYELAGMIKANGIPNFARIEEETGVRDSTLRNWRMRKVKRPQHAAAKGVLLGLGAEYAVLWQGKRVLPGRIVSRQEVVEQRAARRKARKKKAA
jgi:hypothetical protein